MSQANLPKSCPACQSAICIESLHCPSCKTRIEGEFALPRLARLSSDDQQFIELMVIHEGSLKALAAQLEVSYPTVRKRLDDVISRLEDELKSDHQRRKS